MVLKDVLVQESTGKVGCHFNILRGAECLQVSAGGTGSQRSTQVSGPGISRLQAFHHGCQFVTHYCLMLDGISLLMFFFVLIFYSSNLRLFFLLITRVRSRGKPSSTCFSYWVVEMVCLFCFFHFVPEDVTCLVCCNFLLCSIVILRGQVVCFACYF